MSVHCTELLKTAEIQPCCSFSPEAPSQLQSLFLEPRSNESKQRSFGSVDRKLVFHFWNARASIPLFPWDHLSIRIHILPLFRTSIPCPLLGLVAHLQRSGISLSSYGCPALSQSLRSGLVIPFGDLQHLGLFSELSQLRLAQPENFFRKNQFTVTLYLICQGDLNQYPAGELAWNVGNWDDIKICPLLLL